jgi:hypothetical protein
MILADGAINKAAPSHLLFLLDSLHRLSARSWRTHPNSRSVTFPKGRTDLEADPGPARNDVVRFNSMTMPQDERSYAQSERSGEARPRKKEPVNPTRVPMATTE